MSTAPEDRRQMWDERYAAGHVWSEGPNRLVESVVGGWPPGRALDLGAGEGRHALWLASLGWAVTAVDFSGVGIAHGRDVAASRGLDIEWVVADAAEWLPPEEATFDLVLLAYLHLAEDVVQRAARWLTPGGALLVVGHALRNLTEGVGGPQDPSILHTPEGLRRAADELEIERCEEVPRTTEAGTAIDVVLLGRRPAGARR